MPRGRKQADPKVFYKEKNPQRQGNLEGQLSIIGTTGMWLILVREGEEDDPMADTQMYELDRAALFDQIKPLGVWLKFIYVPVEGMNPPIPFTPDEAALRVEAYRAARAKAAMAEESEE